MSPANRAKLGAYLMVGIVALMLFITGTQRSQGSGRLASADGISSGIKRTLGPAFVLGGLGSSAAASPRYLGNLRTLPGAVR
jgi:hypothetical protein